MSVVVSDTSPLHYLILCDAQTILPGLFHKVVIPPMVFAELQQPSTPDRVQDIRLDPQLIQAALERTQTPGT